jgi:cell division protein FtsZ
MSNSHMVFITAGMGGGTGTGAAPVIARLARELGILTVGVVTKPFSFEGARRMRTAEEGIERLKPFVDTLIVVPNQNLFRIANDKTTFAKAFEMADEVLYAGVRGVTDLMVMPGLINLDFADVRTVIGEMGTSMMGMGEAEGEGRAKAAAEAAISNPLLDVTSMKGAKGVLINITGGMDLTLFEVDEAANKIRQEVDADANIIVGSTFDERLNGRIRVSVVATGIASESRIQAQPPRATAAQGAAKRVQQPASATPTAIIDSVRPSAAHPVSGQATAPVIEPLHPVHAMQDEIARTGLVRGLAPEEAQPAICQRVHRGIEDIEADRPAQGLRSGSQGQAAMYSQSPETVRKSVGFSVFGITIGANGLSRKAPASHRQVTSPAGLLQTRVGGRVASDGGRITPIPSRDGEVEALEGFGDEQLDIPAFLRRQGR